MSSIALANLWLRVASRVVVRVTRFHARSFIELERHARRIPWARFLTPGARVAFRVTARKSKLYHTGAIAQRLFESAARSVSGVIEGGSERADEADNASGVDESGEDDGSLPQLFIVRFSGDECVVSADTSGELLHRRGYRLSVAKAPLRETLAAAILRSMGWNGQSPLLDPMCGAGTIPIEAALIARRIPPGIARSFAFMDWAEHRPDRWNELLDRAKDQTLGRSPVRIVGADRDAGAIESAMANAERAGVAADIDLRVRAISATERFADAGLMVVNPPYGMRVRGGADIRDLYARLGAVIRERFAGWDAAILSPDRALESQLGLPLAERFRTTNGGIPVRLMVASPAVGTRAAGRDLRGSE